MAATQVASLAVSVYQLGSSTIAWALARISIEAIGPTATSARPVKRNDRLSLFTHLPWRCSRDC